MTYAIDRETRVYSDEDGDWLVGFRDDRDGLGLCEIFYSEKTASNEILIPWEVARILAREILKQALAE